MIILSSDGSTLNPKNDSTKTVHEICTINITTRSAPTALDATTGWTEVVTFMLIRSPSTLRFGQVFKIYAFINMFTLTLSCLRLIRRLLPHENLKPTREGEKNLTNFKEMRIY